jgi:putative flippase GtrA
MNRLILWFVYHMPKPIQKLYFKYEEIWLYIFYGGLTTVIAMVTKLVPLYLADAEAMGHYYVYYSAGCAVFAWTCAVFFAFFTNRKYVFKSTVTTRKGFWKEMVNFLIGRLASLGIDAAMTAFFIGWLMWNAFWVTIVGQIIILIVNFLFSKLFVFRETESKGQQQTRARG